MSIEEIDGIKRDVCAEVDRLAPAAGRRQPPDPRQSRAQLRGALSPTICSPACSTARGWQPSATPTASTPRSRLEPATAARCRCALRVRRAARHRPRVRPQHHRHRRARRRPRRRGGRRPGRRAAADHRAHRPRRAAAARSRWPATAPSHGLDAAMMVHPADADLIRMDAIAIQQVDVHFARAGRPRRGRAAGGTQRARRGRARLHERGRAAPAHPAHRADPRHLPQGRRQGQHRAGGGGRCSGWCARRRSPACSR